LIAKRRQMEYPLLHSWSGYQSAYKGVSVLTTFAA
jgi:hypothetical protein